MLKYKCGHEPTVAIFNTGPLALATYFSWLENEGKRGEMCFACYCNNKKGNSRIACKYCIATKGLKGSELGKDGKSFETQKEFVQHLKDIHGITVRDWNYEKGEPISTEKKELTSKSEPLKNKINENNITDESETEEPFSYVESYFLKEDIASAVRWLKEHYADCLNIENAINEAFEDCIEKPSEVKDE